MIQQQVYIINAFLMLSDSLCIITAGFNSLYFYNNIYDNASSLDKSIITASVVLIIFINNYIMGKLHLYSDRRPTSYFYLFWSIAKAIIIDFTVLFAFMFALEQFLEYRRFLIIFAELCFLLLFIERFFVSFYISKFSMKGFNNRKLLVVGDMKRGKIVSDILKEQLSWGHEIIGRLSIIEKNDFMLTDPENNRDIGSLEDLSKVLRIYAVDEVIFALEKDSSINLSKHLSICKKLGVPVRILPAMWKPGKHSISVEKCQGLPFITVQASNFNANGLLYKRVIDLIGGIVGSVLLLVMYPFISIAIKLDSQGPVFFKQKRVGKNGRIFKLYKFRSMYKNAEKSKKKLICKNEMNGQIFKIKNDPRVTGVGKWLRKNSLDEFPQFINVLRGEMSLVGTRPPTPEEVDKYQLWHLKRISIKPGITGLWQISGRNQIRDFDKIVELDCRYIDQWRFFDDIKIILQTVIVVLQRKGAI